MHIHLNDEDISKMPESLYRSLLDWLLKTKNLRFEQTQVIQQPKPVVSSTQLLLNLDSQKSEDKADNSHVRLSELFDAGMTKRAMAIRVKLKRKEAKKRGGTISIVWKSLLKELFSITEKILINPVP